MAAPLVVLALWAGLVSGARAVQADTDDAAPSAAVVLAVASNISQCLTIAGRQVTVGDCLSGGGAGWAWSPESAAQPAKLSLVPTFAELGASSLFQRRLAAGECLREDFLVWPCGETEATWSWSRQTMQIKAGHNQCLAVHEGHLNLTTCANASDDQQGNPVPAEQTWVLMPQAKPQVDVLSSLSFPLRSVGRSVVDSEGRRVKLAGVNWREASVHANLMYRQGSRKEALGHIARTVKYLGFNAVRVPFGGSGLANPTANAAGSNMRLLVQPAPEMMQPATAEAMLGLHTVDEVIEAATHEGLLVVLSAEGPGPWRGEDRSTREWLDLLVAVARRYRGNPRVIGINILGGPASEGTLPLWGVPLPEIAAGLARLVGLSVADWRTAAAQGAVAVWQGNPDALVVVDGQLFATGLQDVEKLPLALGQGCLASRLVYATSEHPWLQGFTRFYQKMSEWWNPMDAYDSIKAALREATAEQPARPAGEAPLQYESYAEQKNTAAYFLDTADEAPVWLGAFSASRRTSARWASMLRLLRQRDASWFFWPSNADEAGAGAHDFGVFDTSGTAFASVIGWKLQDLLDVQAPASGQAQQLRTPGECKFDAAANLEAASAPTTVYDFASTTPWYPWQIVLLAPALLLALLVVLLLACCCGCCCRRLTKAEWLAKKSAAISPRALNMEANPNEQRRTRSVWCCACRRELPVPQSVAAMLPQSALQYSQLSPTTYPSGP